MNNTTEPSLSPRPGSLKELLRIAFPLVVSSSSQSLMHVLDRIFLAWHSEAELAASVPAGLTNWTIISFAFGTALYCNVFVAQYFGAGNKDRVTAVIWQGVYAAIAMGLLLLFCLPFAPAIFRFIGHEQTLQRYEVDYFSILALGTTPLLVGTVLTGFFTGRGQNHIVMVVNIIAVLLNGLLDYLLVFGIGPFPELGIRGAAIGTVTSFTLIMLCYVYVIWKEAAKDGFHFRKNRQLDIRLSLRIIRFGLPTGVQIFADGAGFALVLFVVGNLGKSSLAATNLTFNLNMLAFVPMIGLGTAVSTLVGRRIGENRPDLAVRTVWFAVSISLVYMSLWIIGFLFTPYLLMEPYFWYNAGSEELRTQVVILLRFVAMYSLFDSLAIIFGNAIRGAGDTRFSMIVLVCSSLFLLVLPAVIIAHYYENNLYLCWSAATSYIVVIGILFCLRFLSRKWMKMKVIEQECDAQVENVKNDPKSKRCLEPV